MIPDVVEGDWRERFMELYRYVDGANKYSERMFGVNDPISGTYRDVEMRMLRLARGEKIHEED